jgi:lysophospholipase L1-like esterase
MVKVPMTEEWKDYEVPVSGGPAAPQSAFFVELFSPGSADLAGFRLETVPKSLYVPDTAKAVAREDEGWLARHRELCARAAKAQPKVVILGDSITQRWEQNGREAWSQSVAPLQAANFGIDGDGTEHLLWRIRNSGLGQAFQPKLAVLLIGVNNIGAGCMPNDVALGAAACVSAVRQQSPGTRVLLLGVFPMAQSGDDGVRKTIREVNAGYAALADGRQVFFSDIGGAFLEKDASIAPAVMDDFLHLTPKGYGIYAKEIAPVLRKLLAN